MFIPSAENWRKIVSRGKYPLLFIYELNSGLLNFHKITGFKIRMKNYCRTSKASYIYQPEAQRVVQKIREVLKNNPRKTLKWINNYFHQSQRLLNWLNQIGKKIANRRLKKSDLKKYFHAYILKTQIIWRWGYLPFLMDEAIEAELNWFLGRLQVHPKRTPKIIKILNSSSKTTPLFRERIELLKLAARIKRYRLMAYKRQIQAHLTKWGWKNSWIYNQHPLTQEQLGRELRSLIKKQPEKIIRKIENEKAKSLQQKAKILLIFKNRKLKTLAQILSEYNWWHSYKMEEMTRAIYLARPLFDQLASSLGLSYEQFIELTPPEIQKNSMNIKLLSKRRQACGILTMNDKTRVLSPSQLKEVQKQIEKKFPGSQNLKGTVAFPGKAHGRVIIVHPGKADILKVPLKPGDILVTPMITTNMVSLVTKAAAIVTEEGGIICHAAIISREYRKPCIVGTRIATKVLKTGDMVEVDAEQGIVRKLSK